LGYTNVKVFSDGYPAWVKYAGQHKTAAAAPAATSVKAGAEEGSIDIAYFQQTYADNPDAFYLVDVRDPEEFAKGTIKGAQNIPVDRLEAKIPSLPTDKPIVFICGTGARSGESFYMVQDVRPELKNVYYIDAEMKVNKDGSFTLTKPAGM
jgi:rhodanese-related sulfurtransferase